ncbi:MAG: flagellar protein FliS, partial [Rubripirellula sp.]
MSTNPENFRPRHGSGSQQYLESAIRMATPARLRLMVTERAVEVATTLARVWKSGEQQGPNEHSLSLLELIGELLSGISGSEAPEEKRLCNQISDLYVFLAKHLVSAEDHSDFGAVEEIRLVLELEAETWRAVCAQELMSKQAASASSTPTPMGASA